MSSFPLSKHIQQIIDSPNNYSRRQVHTALAAVERQQKLLADFIPWPALIESFSSDARKLRQILDRSKEI